MCLFEGEKNDRVISDTKKLYTEMFPGEEIEDEKFNECKLKVSI